MAMKRPAPAAPVLRHHLALAAFLLCCRCAAAAVASPKAADGASGCKNGCGGDVVNACGIDGNTYQNACIARCQGVAVVVPEAGGACPAAAAARAAAPPGAAAAAGAPAASPDGGSSSTEAARPSSSLVVATAAAAAPRRIISAADMGRFRSEGFTLLGLAEASKLFDPAAAAAAAAASTKGGGRARSSNGTAAAATAGAAAAALTAAELAYLLTPVRYTSDGLVYIGRPPKLPASDPTRSGAAAASSSGTTAGQQARPASPGFIPAGMPIDGEDRAAAGPEDAAAAGGGGGGNASRRLLNVFGRDDRREVTGTQTFPYSAVGLLSYKLYGKSYGCTGFMISARAVMTAAHCVFSREEWAWQATGVFEPARRPSASPYGTFPYTSTVTTFRGWTDRSVSNPWPYDIAVIQLSGSGATLGKRTGWLGMEQAPARFSDTLYTAGYPGDKRFGSMWQTSCSVADDNGSDGQIYYSCDIYSGQSGSPLWVRRGSSSSSAYYVRGVVSWGDAGGRYLNGGAEFTSALWDAILGWR